jgi:GT2 family glycosyltransferase
MIEVSCSIVLFHNPVNEITKAIKSFLSCTKNIKLYLIDNSADDSLRFVFESFPLEYIYNGRNLGYGAAHNIAIQRAINVSKYHLILNPDVEFEPTVLNRLTKFMEQHHDIGLIMPKVLYLNGDMQHLCKMLPSPTDLFMRRFVPGPFKFLFKKILDKYELRNKDYNSIMETPNLSGCFMFIRTSVFSKIGVFDERYFLYLEDTDLCRRISEQYRTVYYPGVSIIHGYSKASYKNFKLMKLHLTSSIKYFNKWGWFNDRKRVLINTSILDNSYGLKRKLPLRTVIPVAGNGSPRVNNKKEEIQVNELMRINNTALNPKTPKGSFSTSTV